MMAGLLGLHPDPFTLRQLDEMTDARVALEWNLNSWLRAQILNVNRGRNQKAIEPSKVNPYEAAKRDQVKRTRKQPDPIESALGFAMMRSAFCQEG